MNDADIIAQTGITPAGTRTLACLRPDGVRGAVHLCADGSFYRRYDDGEEHILSADGCRRRTANGQTSVVGGALSSAGRHILFVNWHTAFMCTWAYDAPLRMWLPYRPLSLDLSGARWQKRWRMRGVRGQRRGYFRTQPRSYDTRL